MLKISYILFCVVPLILAIPFMEQENELHEKNFHLFDKVLTPVSNILLKIIVIISTNL